VQWSDIDYMKLHLDWTYDDDGNYRGLPDIVKDLHDHSQKYVIIVVSLGFLCVLFHAGTVSTTLSAVVLITHRCSHA